jgi:hypothetical protein
MTILGKAMEVSDVPFTSSREPFSEYELEDGSVLKVRNVATSILRIQGQFTPDGRPIYIVLTTPAVKVHKSKLKPKNVRR